jgi:hypothetical protein
LFRATGEQTVAIAKDMVLVYGLTPIIQELEVHGSELARVYERMTLTKPSV